MQPIYSTEPTILNLNKGSIADVARADVVILRGSSALDDNFDVSEDAGVTWRSVDVRQSEVITSGKAIKVRATNARMSIRVERKTLSHLSGEHGERLPVLQYSIPSDGGITLSAGRNSFSPDEINGRLPSRDVPIMFYRRTGRYTPISLPSPYNALSGFVTHPAIVYVPDGWNGYRYWMVYTPMPKISGVYDALRENPCICASNDLYNWVLPSGAPNPLFDAPIEGNGSFNSDTHMILSPDGAELIMVWRERHNYTTGGTTYNDNRIMLSRSSDGVKWSGKKEIWRGDVPTDKRLMASPSIWYDPAAGKWVIVGHHCDGTLYKFHRITSSSLDSGWDTVPVDLVFPAPAGRQWWHSWLTRLPSGKIIGVAHDNNGSVGATGRLYLAQSIDGINFESVLINQGYTSSGEIYRSSIFAVEKGGGVQVGLVTSYLDRATMTAEMLNICVPYELVGAEYSRFSKSVEAAVAATGAGLPSAVLAADTFNRSDNAASLGTTLDGKTWTQRNATIMGVASNRAVAGGAALCIATVDVGTTNYSVSAVIAESAKTSHIVIDYVDANNMWLVGPEVGGFVVIRIVAGVATYMTLIANASVLAGDIVRVDQSGKSIRAYLNGRMLYQGDAVVANLASNVGLRTFSTPGSFDSFCAMPIAPDF